MGIPELEVHRQQLEQVKAQAKELTAELTEEQFNWRPGPNQWSIEECLAHLTMVGQSQAAAIDRAIEEAKARRLTGSGPFHYGRLDRAFVRWSEPPVRRKFPAPRRFQPLHGQPITAVLPTFLHLQSVLILQMERAEGLDLARVKVPTPISRFLRMSLGMTFAQIAAHERRHMEQARKVRELL